MDVNNPPTIPAILTSLGALIQQVLFGLGPIILVVVLVYAGYMRLTAADNAQKVKVANYTIMWAVAGYAVVLGAFLIIRLVASLLGYNVGGSVDVTL